MINARTIEQKDGSTLFKCFDSFEFEQGGNISPLSLVYETYGQLSLAKDNVILIHHALSTSCHVASTQKNNEPGWWEQMVGTNKTIDTNKYFVICINNLGSCFGSSSAASINPGTNQPYFNDFPNLTIADIVRSQKFLLSYLGIKSLFAVIGNSMGAMISLMWAILFPNSVQYLISVSSCYKASPVSIAIHKLQEEIIKLDPGWCQGRYTKNPIHGFETARKLGLLSYRHPASLNLQFENSDLTTYLSYNAKKFSENFDANCYLSLIHAMDNFDVTRGYRDKDAPFDKIKAKVLIISVNSDLLFLPKQQTDLYGRLNNAGVDVEYKLIDSHYGHDGFYKDKGIESTIKKFLDYHSLSIQVEEYRDA